MQCIFLLLWVGIIKIILSQSAQSKSLQMEGIGNSNVQQKYNMGIVLLSILPLVLVTTFRAEDIGDTGAYIGTYKLTSTSFESAFDILKSDNTKDKGFYFLVAIIKCILKNNDRYHIFLFIIAAFQAFAVAYMFKKFSSDFAFSLFLFIASTDYVSWMFNGIRQFMAVSIILIFTPFIIRRKYFVAILAILLASTMHQSALIMIPIVLICLGKAFNKRTLFFMIFALLAVVFVGEFTDILNSSLESTQYKNVVSDYTGFGDDGTSIIRILIYSFPAIIAFWGRKKIQETDNAVINFCSNMSIVTAGIYLISMFTSGIFLGRLPIYCSMYCYVLLPWEIQNLFSEDKRKNIRMFIIVLYIVYYIVELYLFELLSW